MSDYRTPVKGWGGKHYEEIYNDFLDWLEETGREPLPGMHWDGWKQNLVVPVPGHPHTNLQVYINGSDSSPQRRCCSVHIVIESGFGSELAEYLYAHSNELESELGYPLEKPGTFSRFNWWFGLSPHWGNTLDLKERRALFVPVYDELTKLGEALTKVLSAYQGEPPKADQARALYTADRLRRLLDLLGAVVERSPSSLSELKTYFSDEAKRLDAEELSAHSGHHTHPMHYGVFEPHAIQAKVSAFRAAVFGAVRGDARDFEDLVVNAFGSVMSSEDHQRLKRIGHNLKSTSYRQESRQPATQSYPTDVQQLIEALKHKPQLVLYGAPGTGKTRVARRAAYALLGGELADIDDNDQVEAYLSEQPYELVVFHPAYDYDQFIGGLKVTLTASGQPNYEQVPGVFTRLCEQARSQPNQPHILVIDEINRGNLPKLLGELIYALEYRDSEVVFSFDGKPRTVPSNLYVMGTMNTADRSVGSLDAAIRRRFAFLRVDPNPSVVGSEPLRMLMTTINERLAKLAERMPELSDLQVGHSYFLGCKPKDFSSRWQYEIKPLLEDYQRLTGEPEIGELCASSWHSLLPPDLSLDWDDHEEKPLIDGLSLVSKSKGLKAEGYLTGNNGFVVLQGSMAALVLSDSSYDYEHRTRKHLLDEGILKAADDHLVFTKDHLFTSPSASAAAVLGRPSRGPTLWRNTEGQTLAELVAALGIDNAQNGQSDAQSERWNFERFQAAIKQQLDDRDVQVMSELFAWAEVNTLRRWWGSGKGSGSCFFQADIEGAGRHTFAVWTSGLVEFQFPYYRKHPAYAADEDLHTLRNQFNTVPGINLDEAAINKRPSLSVSLLREPEVLQQFFGVWDRFLETVGFNTG